MPSYYVSKKDDMTNRRLWDFMKDMGVEIMCGEPDPASLGKVEALCKEYGIKLAIHNHPEGRSIYWNPETAMRLVAGQGRLGPEIGFCPDVGHWGRSAVDVLKGLAMNRERAIPVLHVKDIPAIGEGWKDDAPLGKGVLPFTEVFDALSAWKWQGIVTIELEAIPASLPNIAACARYIDDSARTQAAALTDDKGQAPPPIHPAAPPAETAGRK